MKRRPVVPPTTQRRYIDGRSHMPPAGVTDNVGGVWRGASRVLDRPARRKAQRRSWLRAKVEARRAFVASTRDVEDLAA